MIAPDTFDPYEEYRKQLLSPVRVRELSQLQPWRVVRDTLWYWSWIFAAWTSVALWPQWWVVALAVVVIGMRYYALLIIAHDAIHRRLFRDVRWNDNFADLFIFGAVAGITRINNQNHLGHHRNLATPEDPDLHQFTCTNKHHWQLFVGQLSGVTSFYRSFKNVFLRTPRLEKAATSASLKYTFRDMLLIFLWQAALLGGLTWCVAWWAYPLLWMAPVYVAFVLDNFRAFAEHSQPEPDELADRHRLITFVSHPVERMFVAPCNMNYHAAHHLWPSIPYYHLPQADREIQQLPAAADLEWRGTYLGYALRYFRLLPLKDCNSPVNTGGSTFKPSRKLGRSRTAERAEVV